MQDIGADNSTTQSEASELAAVESSIKGENPHTFRVMEATVDEGLVPSVRVPDVITRTAGELATLEPSFLQHEPVTGRPFTASYLSLDKVYSEMPPKEQKSIQRIDAYIKSKIESKQYQDTAESAAKIIQEIESRLRLKDHHDPFYKAERIANYLDAVGDFEAHKMLKPRFTKSALQAKKMTETATKKVVEKVEQQLQQLKPKKDMALHKKVSELAVEASKLKQDTELHKKIDTLNASEKKSVSELSRKLTNIERTIESTKTSPQLDELGNQISSLINMSRALNETQLQTARRVEEVIAKNQELQAKQAKSKSSLERLLKGL